MRKGDLQTAWRIGDAMLAARNPATRDDPSLPYHERWVWDGTSPNRRRVLIRCYHGLGDTLQFARFIPALRAIASHVTVEAQAELCPLLATMPCIDSVVPFDVGRPLPPSQCDIEIMELGQVLRVGTHQLAAAIPYFKAPVSQGPEAKIALCWQAGDWDPARSIPLHTLLQALPKNAGYVSLQRGPQAAAATEEHFTNPNDSDTDILRTASLIGASRHVITVDTMVAHLTGALGHPGTVLLRSHPDWRWSHQNGQSLWYPSLRLAWIEDVEAGKAVLL